MTNQLTEVILAFEMKLTEVILAFEMKQTQLNEETMPKLKDDHYKEITELKDKLEVRKPNATLDLMW